MKETISKTNLIPCLGGPAASGEVALDGQLVQAEGGRGHVLAGADTQPVRDLGDLLAACVSVEGGGGGGGGRTCEELSASPFPLRSVSAAPVEQATRSAARLQPLNEKDRAR